MKRARLSLVLAAFAAALVWSVGGCIQDQTTSADVKKSAKEIENSKPDQPEYPPDPDLKVAPPGGGKK